MKREQLKTKDYDNLKTFLLASFDHLKGCREGFSLRSWSKELGYENPGYLSNVLRGNKKLTVKMIGKISQNLELDLPDQEYLLALKSLEDLEKKKDDQNVVWQTEYQKAKNAVMHLKEQRNYSISINRLKQIGGWVGIAIYEMTLLRDFTENYQDIAKLLGSKVSPQKVELSIDRMLEFGILSRDNNGRLQKGELGNMFTGNEGPNKIIQQYHLEVLDLMKERIISQDYNQRTFNSTIIAIHESKKKQLENLINEFTEKLHSLVDHENANHLYQINLQSINLLNRNKK